MHSTMLDRILGLGVLATAALIVGAYEPADLAATPAGTVAAGSATRLTATEPEIGGGAWAVAASPAGEAEIAMGGAGTASPDRSAADDAELALAALSRYVERPSDPEALETAFRAYFGYREARPDQVRKPYLYYVDLGLDNRTRRGWVFDMERLTLVEGPFTVAHGRGSARGRDDVPASFSNRPGSNASSLGLYLAQETYTFRGKSGGRAYRSVGLRLRGESGAFNDAARRRGIVAHGAPYVTRSDAGRSEGCPAMEPGRAARLLPRIANGGVVFIFSPKDETWLREDPWVNAE